MKFFLEFTDLCTFAGWLVPELGRVIDGESALFHLFVSLHQELKGLAVNS